MFKTRLLSGIVLVAILLAGILLGNWVFWALILFVSLVGLYELYKLEHIEKTPMYAATVTDAAGNRLMEILSPRSLLGGNHILSLEDGFFADLDEGSYRVVLAWNGAETAGALTVGRAAPAPQPAFDHISGGHLMQV